MQFAYLTTETADKSIGLTQQLRIASHRIALNSATDVRDAVVSPEIQPGDEVTPMIPALIFAAPDIAAFDAAI